MTMHRPLAFLWPDIKSVFADLRPDLLAEVEAFGPRPPSELAHWFDERIPRPGGERWGRLALDKVPDLLREQLENARVR